MKRAKNNNKIKTAKLAIALTRVVFSAIFLFNPLLGYFFWAVLDIADCQILVHILRMNKHKYQFWDKKVDFLTYVFMLAASLKYQGFFLLLALLVFRFIGQYAFWKTKKDVYLILFPNFFEVGFIYLVILGQLNITKLLTPALSFTLITILFLLKIGQEYIMHAYTINRIFPWFALLAEKIIPGYKADINN